MSVEDDIPDPPDNLLRWNENIGQHIDKFVDVTKDSEAKFDSLDDILQTVAQWYVRKDGKYYDVEEPGPVFSRNDVERVIVQRLKESYPTTKLSQDDVRQLLQVLIKDIFVDPRRSIPIWSGLRQSMPGNPNRLTFKRMVATINTWREPSYRRLGVSKATWGPFKDFMETTFTREDERDMLTNWLAWCLQHEGDKPGWAPFLFSAEKGSGKSTFSKIAGKLFGDQNTATENNINKLVSRFNAPVLEKKLVICEELHLPPGSDKSNAVKTFITEKEAVVEHKYQAVQQVEQFCCFIFITNHKPIWIEQGDRRFYVVHVDHDGHRFGPNGSIYAAQVGAMLDHYEDPHNVAALYNAFRSHSIPTDFDPHSLEVLDKSTNVMKEIQESGIDINRKMVEEHLDELKAVAITMAAITDMVEKRLSSKAAALKHVLADLGWTSQNVKWGGKDYKRMIWLRPGYKIRGGKISGPGEWVFDTNNVVPAGSALGGALLGQDEDYFKRADNSETSMEVDISDLNF